MTFGVRHRLGRLANGVRRRILPGAVVLMYHRIAEVEADPWDLAVTPAHFAEHLDVIRRLGLCLTLADLVRAWDEGRTPPLSFVVTFDDGYRDNLLAGLPALEARGIPATLFLVAGGLGSSRPFWWDALERIFLHDRPLPSRLPETLGPVRLDPPLLGLDLREPANARSWCADEEAPATARQRAYLGVWTCLSVHEPERRETALVALEAWAGASLVRDDSVLPLSDEEAARVGASPLLEIGAHTLSHPSLPDLDRDAQRREIFGSRQVLEERFARPVTSFSFPHGRSDEGARSLVREAGFRAACTSHGGVADRFSNRFDLPRVHVKNWNGEGLERALRDYVQI